VALERVALGGRVFGAIAGGTLDVWLGRGGTLDVMGGGPASGAAIPADAAAVGSDTSSAGGNEVASGAASTALVIDPAATPVA
jgi:hypothetical protein